MKQLMLGMLAIYRWLLSPMLHALTPGGCKFHPPCSQYAVEAIQMHGPWRGARFALRRLMRCHPFTKGGFDPVPIASSPAAPNSYSSTHALRAEDPSFDPLP